MSAPFPDDPEQPRDQEELSPPLYVAVPYQGQEPHVTPPPAVVRWRRRVVAVTIIAVAGVAAWAGFAVARQWQFEEQRAAVFQTRQRLADVTDLSNVFREISTAVEPSVVKIDVDRIVDRDGFGRTPPELLPGGSGSGVIMATDANGGYVVTNNHVIAGSADVFVTLNDGRQVEGRIVGTDPLTDLAVLRIRAERLIAAEWGDSDQLQKGDWVLAFGSPFGFVGSMTSGIVSALGRRGLPEGLGAGSTARYENFIQTDAAINPGNSGGPLVDIHGRVIGINTAIFTRTGQFAGIGFAIPSNQAKVVFESIRARGRVVRGWLGVGIVDVSRAGDAVQQLGYDGNVGVLVTQVFRDTPAEGVLQPGDVIRAIEGFPTDTAQQLRNRAAFIEPGTAATLTIVRQGEEREVQVTIGQQPDDLLSFNNPPAGQDGPRLTATPSRMGIELLEPSPEALADLRRRTGGAVHGAAMVGPVEPASPAAQAGIRPGSLIVGVRGRPIRDTDDLIAKLAEQDLRTGVYLNMIDEQQAWVAEVRAR